ncbi:MAG: 4'-phosphopantetheinyl transferase superfamily protein [Gammaproteobacteria bacterium]|nr:4'-phosphopantetheinyl transferase superfamily protein [Pseudomonadales bacterium]MCP5330120.1 4'-phosphopantetheinyl transferase superfamily protein [Pseudomonadales bacterium]
MRPPEAQDIHLWCIAPMLLEESSFALLSAEEQAHYQRIGAATVKQQYWQTRLGIRQLLSLYSPAVPPSAWQFRRNAHGRPELHAPALPFGLCFNISHTAGLIVIAVSASGAIGVDVERSDRNPRVLELAHRYFSTRELADLRALPSQRQGERFLRLWTLKEAYIKACGMGLAIPLDSFSFLLEKGDIDVAFAPVRGDEPGRWRFWQFALGENHLCALALRRDEHPDNYAVQVLHLQDWAQVEPIAATVLAASAGLS